MILINGSYLIRNTIDLNAFIQDFKGEIYDENSKKINDCIVEFLEDVWERDVKLTTMVHKKISEEIFPLELVDVHETADFTTLEVKAISTRKDYRLKKSEELTFNEYNKRYFKSLVSLWDRFQALDIK